MMVVMSMPAVNAIGNDASMNPLVRNSTHKIRTSDPLSVSDTVCLLRESACSMLDNGGCREYRAKGIASCFSSNAPCVL